MGRIKLNNRRSVCPVACALEIFGDAWTLIVIRDLACGKTQYKELSGGHEGISTNILADRLRRMVELGLVEKFRTSKLPGRDQYRLTPRGYSLGPILSDIAKWGLNHIAGTKALLRPDFRRGLNTSKMQAGMRGN
jgi:DNA-binding HxlR family transcriptional regulator